MGLSFGFGVCDLAAMAHFIEKWSPMGQKYEKVDGRVRWRSSRRRSEREANMHDGELVIRTVVFLSVIGM